MAQKIVADAEKSIGTVFIEFMDLKFPFNPTDYFGKVKRS
jgi:hypothetical protein